MKTVYNRCCQMVPPAPEKKLRKLKFAFSGWKNSNKIESEVRDLRNHVNKCHSRFMVGYPYGVSSPMLDILIRCLLS